MSFLESLLRFIFNALCGPAKPQEPEKPPYKPYAGQEQQQQQQYEQPPVSYPPHHQQQHQYGRPYHHNDYLAHAQDPHYLSLRQQAADLDPEMDRLFDASREAYKRGEGAEAKELSNKAKALKAEGERLNREAADWIFNQNNSGREAGEIDLHGLKAEEAVERTEQFINDCRQQGLTDLRLIVGKGIHSQNHHAVLKPRIEELMKRENIVAELDPENSGILLVHLDSRASTRGRAIDPEEITNRLGDEDKGCIVM